MFAILACCLLAGQSLAYNPLFGSNPPPQVETRSIDEIHKAALAEGGVVTAWMGGDEPNAQDVLKKAFEERFPGMTLNVTVDLSKYHDGKIDQQLAQKNVFVDSVILQTIHDFPRWAAQGALLNYAPLGFDQVHPAFKESQSATWYGLRISYWSMIWNTAKLGNDSITEFDDFLKPEFKDKLVLTYPNDDDAILRTFDLILHQHGVSWLDRLLQQNPKWVRGSRTPVTTLLQGNNSYAMTFTSRVGVAPPAPLKAAFPTKTQFTSWSQSGAILKDAPHPEGAKLLHSYMLSPESPGNDGWTVRQDIPLPANFPYPPLFNMTMTDTVGFASFMADRARIERLKLWFEDKLGTAQGLSPLKDNF